ncbi:hypothetical protein HA466_0199110 [Hirschfeldia incana]|nr:hypothetical protein HA466_0199110 [Hirschfeldia incana]
MAELPTILDSVWHPLAINFDYHCAECNAVICLEVFRSGHTYMHVAEPHLYPEVEVAYDEERGAFSVRSTHCDIAIYFSTHQGNSGNIMVDP